MTWNCKDYAGKVAPDDTYRVYFEVTDSNNTGPNHFEAFTKGPSAIAGFYYEPCITARMAVPLA